ncbi:hypothetical protein C8R44DRAFT_879984 [Mycena epipterygia]|nr:hypothetical protein C8R44DRAFT_879984 [Mycena epipterygia]
MSSNRGSHPHAPSCLPLDPPKTRSAGFRLSPPYPSHRGRMPRVTRSAGTTQQWVVWRETARRAQWRISLSWLVGGNSPVGLGGRGETPLTELRMVFGTPLDPRAGSRSFVRHSPAYLKPPHAIRTLARFAPEPHDEVSNTADALALLFISRLCTAAITRPPLRACSRISFALASLLVPARSYFNPRLSPKKNPSAAQKAATGHR